MTWAGWDPLSGEGPCTLDWSVSACGPGQLVEVLKWDFLVTGLGRGQ